MPVKNELLAALGQQAQAEEPWITSTELAQKVSASWATVKRQLESLVVSGQVVREGKARATRYRLANRAMGSRIAESPLSPFAGPVGSQAGQELRAMLTRPLSMREVVTYQRAFVDDYVPNHSALLPQACAAELATLGRMQGQQPAGTYARKVLEPLLIDLSWSSSRLEGNRYSLFATAELFKSGVAGGDIDAVMLLNHKAAIEFLVDTAPEYGLTSALIRNLHAVLMQDLLADASGLGSIRQKVVNISDTTFIPTQVPSLLEEMFNLILEKARQVKNPVESAFFLWVNLAYLQPFEDGNKRTSRLAANVPLMLYNCAPLSFLDVDVQDYAYAMMGVYEYRNVALAADLFDWAYRRSINKYAVTLEAMGMPDPLRLQFREALNDAMGLVVREGKTAEHATAALSLPPGQVASFRPLLDAELRMLEVYNCARYRLTMGQVKQWIEAGRPQ